MDYGIRTLKGPEGTVTVYDEHKAAAAHRNWIFGSFIHLPDGTPLSESFEVKRGFFKAGTSREEWSSDPAGESFEIVLSGKLRKYFMIDGKEEVVETGPGDAITWNNTVPHRWLALEDTELVFVRTLQ